MVRFGFGAEIAATLGAGRDAAGATTAEAGAGRDVEAATTVEAVGAGRVTEAATVGGTGAPIGETPFFPQW